MPVNPHTEPDTIESLSATYQVDVAHARHVALLALGLFDALQPIHAQPGRMRDLLAAGAQLHNVGLTTDEPNHHTAGRDIIVASALQGFDPAERVMLACMAAFHRKIAQPEGEPLFNALTAPQQQQTLVLSALLRVADGLDYSQSQTTTLEENRDSTLETSAPVQSPISNPQSPLIRVRGPYSHEDAARALKKADLWDTLFPPLRITGFMTRPGIALNDTIAYAGRRILRYESELLLSDEWLLNAGDAPKPRLIHQLRVMTRRVRSTLRVFKPYYKSKAIQPVLKGVRDLAVELAPLRELDICVNALKIFRETGDEDTRQGTQPLLDAWRLERKVLRAECANDLSGERHAAWLQSFSALLQSDAYDRAIEVGQPHYVRHVVDAIMAQHVADVRAYDTLPPLPSIEEAHALRIAIKRLRYVCEVLREVLPADRAEQIIATCVPAQDAYGMLHDAHIVAGRALRFVAAHRADTQRLDQRAMRSSLAFAEAEQRVVEEHLAQWRSYLAPLLML